MTFALTLLLASNIALNIPTVTDGTPNKQPQLASGNGAVAMVFGSGTAVMFAKSADEGKTFSPAVKVADVPGLMLGRHRGPRVVFAGKTILVSAIAGGQEGNLLLWRSNDGGMHWTKGPVINDVATAAREGLHGMAADEGGHAAAVWLDLREKGTRLYGAYSNDFGATWSRNVLVYESPEGTICQCCHPTITSAGKGEFAVMFRNFTGGNRDMYVVRVRNGEVVRAAEKMGDASWQLNACPMDGGGVAIDDGHLVTAWRRGPDIFLSGPGQKEAKIGSGADVALAASRGKTYAVWSHGGAVESWSGGEAGVLSPSGAFPAVVALPMGEALAAWEANGAIEVRRLGR